MTGMSDKPDLFEVVGMMLAIAFWTAVGLWLFV